MFNKYPYTDLHELNLDWFLNQFKELVSDWDTFKTDLTEQWEQVSTDWQTLSDYVHDYFDNLDVQDEIDNKLDSLISAGTFNAIVDPVIINSVDDWLSENITPTTPAVDSTLTISGAAADAKVTGDQLRILNNLILVTETKNFTTEFVTGYFPLNISLGSIVSNVRTASANYASVMIPCKVGDIFTVSGTGGAAPRLYGFTDEDMHLLSVAAENITVSNRELTAADNGYFICNANINSTYTLTAILNSSHIEDISAELTDIQDDIDNVSETLSDHLINMVSSGISVNDQLELTFDLSENSRMTGVSANYEPIIAVGSSCVKAFEIPENGGMIWTHKLTAAGQMFIIYTAGTKALNYVKSANADSFLIINDTDKIVIDLSAIYDSGYTHLAIAFDTVEESGIYQYNGQFSVKNNLDYVTPLTGLNMFDTVACLGDSYTKGYVVKSDSSSAIAKKPFPAVLADDLGITVDNFGVGGTTAKSYITHAEGLPTVLDSSAHDLYLICFGINDAGSAVTVGTVADINDADYTQNADTFCGNLAKIYQMTVEAFPLARFAIIGNWAIGLWYSGYIAYAKAAKAVADHFGIPYINPLDDPFFYSDIFTNDVGGHPTQVAYTGMAYALERLMSKSIAENYNYYRYAGIESI